MIRAMLGVLTAYLLALATVAVAEPVDQRGWNARKRSVLFSASQHAALVGAIPHAEARVFADLRHN